MSQPTIRRSHLADGREIVYFDDPGHTRGAPSPDERDLDARPATATLRRDPLTLEWISMATSRQGRVHLPPPELDPLAPQGPGNPSEIPDDYDVVVFENRSPAFGPALGSIDPSSDVGAPIEEHGTAVGRCEVVCFSPERQGSFATQSLVRVRTIVEALAHRTAELSELPGIAQVFPFENRGVEIGVTLHHPHGQVYGYPFVTPRTKSVGWAIDQSGPDLMQRVVDAERAGPRVLFAGEHVTAYVPYAARWPLEVHVTANRHVPDLAEATVAERAEFARTALRVTRALDLIYDAPLPYIAAWHQAPVRELRDRMRLSWHVTSPRRSAEKLKYLAGSEAAMGAWVGDILPERGAAIVRDALARVDAEMPVDDE